MRRQPPPTDDPGVLQNEARVWLHRLHSGKVTEWDTEAFKRWRVASPQHRAAFEEARREWLLMKPAIGDLLGADPSVAEAHRKTLRAASSPRRRAFLGAAVSAAAVAGVATVYPPLGLWPSAREWNADYRTATGEQRRLTLASSVVVEMNTQTSISRRNEEGESVGIDLIAGEAAVDLRAASRTFDVVAGVGRSVAEAARFEVKYLDGRACVTCIEGRMRVEHPSGTRALVAHQQAVYDANTLGPVVGVDAEVLSAWREGVLIFKSTPLVHVLEEINRYRPGRVVLMNNSLRQSPVSGRFAIASLDAVLLQIQHSFELSARSLPGGLLVLG